MQEATSSSGIVRFGAFEVDLLKGLIRKRGITLRLPSQSFQILRILLEEPGKLVTRDEIRHHLWPDDIFVDFENNLNTAMSRLREVLSDSAEHPHYIETVPRRGYRFIGNLKSASRAPRLLVLPFATGRDDATTYFGDAVTDDVIGLLGNLAPERIAVIARTTAMQYKGTHKSITRIGRELDVDFVVEGGVLRVGQRIAVSVQLIQVNSQTQIWADRYEGDLREIFDIERTAAHSLAAQFGVTLHRAGNKPANDVEAYHLYVQGRFHLNQGNSPETYANARACFEQALARDPGFALAYDALAELYWTIGFVGIVPPKEALSIGIFNALRALEIDDTLAETHAMVGQYRKQLDFAWPEVEREMNCALQLAPASPIVRMRYAISYLLPLGRMEEGIRELEMAAESDPLSPLVNAWLGIMLWLGRQYDRGIDQARHMIALDPKAWRGYMVLGDCFRELGIFSEAAAAHLKAAELSGDAPMMLGWLGLTLAAGGHKAEAYALLDRFEAKAAQVYVPPTSFAWIHLGLGEIDEFFSWMDRAIEARDHMITGIKVYAFLDPLRQDPRYRSLLAKMNLEP